MKTPSPEEMVERDVEVKKHRHIYRCTGHDLIGRCECGKEIKIAPAPKPMLVPE